MFRALDGWAQSHSKVVSIGISSARLEHTESIQRCPALLHLESSDKCVRMIHQEAANEIILISETLRHHIVGREEESRIFYCASTKRDCRCCERPSASTCASEFHRFDSYARLGDVYAKHSRVGDERDIPPKISSEAAAEPDFIGPVDGVTTGLPEFRQELIFIEIEIPRPMAYVRPDAIVRDPAAGAKSKVLCTTVKVGSQFVYLERPSGIRDPIATFQVDFIERRAATAPSIGRAPYDSIADQPLVHHSGPPDALNLVKGIRLFLALCAATLQDGDPKGRIRQFPRDRSTSWPCANDAYVASKEVW